MAPLTPLKQCYEACQCCTWSQLVCAAARCIIDVVLACVSSVLELHLLHKDAGSSHARCRPSTPWTCCYGVSS